MQPFKGATPNPEWFRLERTSKRLTQRYIAGELSCHPSKISLFESGKRNISYDLAVHYAKLLGYTVTVSVNNT